MIGSNPPTPNGVLEAALYARDLLAAEQFYRDVLGLRVIASQPGRHIFFCCGQTVLLVFNPTVTARKRCQLVETPSRSTAHKAQVTLPFP